MKSGLSGSLKLALFWEKRWSGRRITGVRLIIDEEPVKSRHCNSPLRTSYICTYVCMYVCIGCLIAGEARTHPREMQNATSASYQSSAAPPKGQVIRDS